MSLIQNATSSKIAKKRRFLVATWMCLVLFVSVGCQLNFVNPTLTQADYHDLATELPQPTLEPPISATPAVFSTVSEPPLNLSPVPSQGVKMITVDELRTRWLSGQPCQPPCWEGITPGVTSRDQAIEILKSNSLFTNVKVIELTDPPSGIVWDMLVDSPYDLHGQAVFDSDNIIYAVEPRIPDTRLDELIQVFGEPSHIMAYVPPGNIDWSLHILWISRGMMWGAGGIGSPPSINGELILEGASFFQPGLLEEYGRVTYFLNVTRVKTWQGFGEFYKYSNVDTTEQAPAP